MTGILHLITDLGAGGAQTSLVRLVRNSDSHRFKHSVVSLTDEGALGRELKEAGIPLHTLGMSRGVPSPLGCLRLIRLLRKLRPDVLQCWLYHANLLGLIAGRIAGIRPVVWGIHSANPSREKYPLLTRWTIGLGAMLSNHPDRILSVSESGKKLHASWGFETGKMLIIANGIDAAIYRPDPEARSSVRSELGVPEETVLIGMVARYHAMKDHETFLRAAQRLNETHPNVHFVMAGPGITTENAALSGMVQEFRVEKVTHLLGSRDDTPRLMASLDLSTLSSWSEAFPNVVGESMACGVPCVVTDVGDAATLVGDTGRIVPPKDPVALAAAWKDLIAMGAEERIRLGKAARLRIEGNFSLAKMVRAYESVYDQLASKG